MSILMTPLFWMTDRPDVIYHGGLRDQRCARRRWGDACWRACLALRVTTMSAKAASLAE